MTSWRYKATHDEAVLLSQILDQYQQHAIHPDDHIDVSPNATTEFSPSDQVTIQAFTKILKPTNLGQRVLFKLFALVTGQAETEPHQRLTKVEMGIVLRLVGWLQGNASIDMSSKGEMMIERAGPLAHIPGYAIAPHGSVRLDYSRPEKEKSAHVYQSEIQIKLSAEETLIVSQVFLEAARRSSKDKDVIRMPIFLTILENGARLSAAALTQVICMALGEAAEGLELRDEGEEDRDISSSSRGKGTYITKEGLGAVLRLVGWAQAGVTLKPHLLGRCGPPARMKGFPVLTPNKRLGRIRGQAKDAPPFDTMSMSLDHADPGPPGEHDLVDEPAIKAGVSTSSNGTTYPALSSARRARYKLVFEKAKPQDGILSSKHVWRSFLISRLPPQSLSRIWDLADTHKTGDLNLEEFCVAMYFIEGLLNGWFTKLPSVGKVPEHILQQAKHPIVIPGEIVKMSSSSKYKPEPKVNRPRKGDGGKQGQSRSGSGGDSSASDPEMVKEAPGTQSDERWGVSAPIQCNSDAVFSPLDPHGTGEVDGFTFAKYMEAHSKLPQSDVATIWHLSDITGKGVLDSHEFGLALFLMHRTLAGVRLPDTLPESFIPIKHRNSKTIEAMRERIRARQDGDDRKVEPLYSDADLEADPFTDPLERLIVPEAVQRRAREMFDILDLDGQGYIGMDVVQPYTTQCQLPKAELERIGNLVDRKGKGRLSKVDFTILLFLMHRVLGDVELPEVLPPSLRESVVIMPESPLDTGPMLMVSSPYDDAARGEKAPPVPPKKSPSSYRAASGSSSEASRPAPPRRAAPPPPPAPILVPAPAPMVLPAESSPVDFDLRNQIVELRSMIQGLMVENDSLRQSVHRSASDPGLRVAATEVEGQAPPAYAEIVNGLGTST